MRRTLAILCLALCFTATAQTEDEFEQFGRAAFNELIRVEPVLEVRPVSIPVYARFIDMQDISEYDKNVLKQRMDANYNDFYQAYEKSFDYLRYSYRIEGEKGSSFTYGETTCSPLPGYKNYYRFNIRFLFQSEEVQTTVYLRFNAVYVDHVFYIFSEIEEDF